MPTLTFQATEMKDAKVAHISLVDRAATRIPFKVIKQEKPMNVLKHLDLASVFKKDKPPATQIVGVITMKSDGYDSVKGQYKEAGFSVDDEDVQKDGSVIFGQTEDMSGEHVLVRLSDNTILAVRGFRPYEMDVQDEDGVPFSEVCKAQGYYPGMGSMIDSLRIGATEVAEKAENTSDAVSQITKMFDEAKQYAVSLVKGLPPNAFKLEKVFPETEIGFEDDWPEDEVALYDQVLKDSAASSKAWATRRRNAKSQQHKDYYLLRSLAGMVKPRGPAKPKATSKEDVAKACDPKDKSKMMNGKTMKSEDDDIVDDTTQLVEELVQKQFEVLATKMESMFSDVSDSIQAVGDKLASLSTRVESAEKVAKAASEAVEGTVVLGGEGGDYAGTARKVENINRGREIDTAFVPRQQRFAGNR